MVNTIRQAEVCLEIPYCDILQDMKVLEVFT